MRARMGMKVAKDRDGASTLKKTVNVLLRRAEGGQEDPRGRERSGGKMRGKEGERRRVEGSRKAGV
eukprot:6193957-Pleurochrysis_carterae.AAC.1